MSEERALPAQRLAVCLTRLVHAHTPQPRTISAVHRTGAASQVRTTAHAYHISITPDVARSNVERSLLNLCSVGKARVSRLVPRMENFRWTAGGRQDYWTGSVSDLLPGVDRAGPERGILFGPGSAFFEHLRTTAALDLHNIKQHHLALLRIPRQSGLNRRAAVGEMRSTAPLSSGPEVSDGAAPPKQRTARSPARPPLCIAGSMVSTADFPPALRSR